MCELLSSTLSKLGQMVRRVVHAGRLKERDFLMRKRWTMDNFLTQKHKQRDEIIVYCVLVCC